MSCCFTIDRDKIFFSPTIELLQQFLILVENAQKDVAGNYFD